MSVAQVHLGRGIDGRARRLAVGLDVEEEFQTLSGDVAALAGDLVGRGQGLDIVKIGNGAVSQYMIGRTKPFYSRAGTQPQEGR